MRAPRRWAVMVPPRDQAMPVAENTERNWTVSEHDSITRRGLLKDAATAPALAFSGALAAPGSRGDDALAARTNAI